MKLTAVAIAFVICGGAQSFAQDDLASGDPSIAQDRTVAAKIESVLLYQGRAAVTRVATVDLTPGIWKLRFDDLPATIQPETLEAKAGAGRILSVDFSERAVPDIATTPEAIEVAAEIRKVDQAIAEVSDLLAGLQSELKVVESVGIRASNDATKEGGTTKLDLAALDSQLAWMATQRTRISAATLAGNEKLVALRKDLAAVTSRQAALGGRRTTVQSAEVLLAMTTEGSVPVRLSYLVTDARWEPVYSIRAAPDRDSMSVEFDALVVQNSGEDWKGVRLSLSTAVPSSAASPPSVAPWFVTVRPPMDKSTGGLVAAYATEPRRSTAVEKDAAVESLGVPSESYKMRERKALAEELSADATVGGTGPSVTYTIALPIDAPSDAQIRRRARIASFEAPTRFVFQTQPVSGDGVFLRGTLSNTSPFQLLPGRASVFVGADYVGANSFAGAAPKQEFSVFFGVDPAVTVRRELISKEDRQSGLFGGGLDTVSDYRVTIANGTGRAIDLELLDRRPISRSDKVEVNLEHLSSPLSTNPEYVETQLPQGILRWDRTVPPTPSGSDGTVITWTVVVSRSKDIDLTPLPKE